MKIFIVLIFIYFFTCSCFCQAPQINWAKTYGGSSDDKCYSIISNSTEGYFVLGESDSHDGDVSINKGGIDVWLLKIDDFGNLVWEKSYGGTGSEHGISISKKIDGGFIVGGTTTSNDSDVSGLHANPLPYSDYWIVNLDTSGNIIWQKCLGGFQSDEFSDIIQTSDSAFFVVGTIYDYSTSTSGDINGFHVGLGSDMWVVKLRKNGLTYEWQKALGGTDDDIANSGIQTPDGGYFVAGRTNSIDGDVSGLHGTAIDIWLVKLNPQGQVSWQKCFGGTALDYAFKVLNAENGNFYVVGTTTSNDGDVSGNHGGADIWVFKADSVGNIIWQKCYGSIYSEEPRDAIKTTDGGLIISGIASGDNGMVSGTHGIVDFWVIKIDSVGNFEWGKSLGGSDYDEAYSVKETLDSGFIVAGTTWSNDGDVSNFHGGYKDMWVVKLSSPTVGLPISEIQLMDFTAMQFKELIFLRFFSKTNSTAQVKLFDLNGKLLYDAPLQIHEGINYSEVPCAKLAEGMYVLEVTGRNVEQRVKVAYISQ